MPTCHNWHTAHLTCRCFTYAIQSRVHYRTYYHHHHIPCMWLAHKPGQSSPMWPTQCTDNSRASTWSHSHDEAWRFYFEPTADLQNNAFHAGWTVTCMPKFHTKMLHCWFMNAILIVFVLHVTTEAVQQVCNWALRMLACFAVSPVVHAIVDFFKALRPAFVLHCRRAVARTLLLAWFKKVAACWSQHWAPIIV